MRIDLHQPRRRVRILQRQRTTSRVPAARRRWLGFRWGCRGRRLFCRARWPYFSQVARPLRLHADAKTVATAAKRAMTKRRESVVGCGAGLIVGVEWGLVMHPLENALSQMRLAFSYISKNSPCPVSQRHRRTPTFNGRMLASVPLRGPLQPPALQTLRPATSHRLGSRILPNTQPASWLGDLDLFVDTHLFVTNDEHHSDPQRVAEYPANSAGKHSDNS